MNGQEHLEWLQTRRSVRQFQSKAIPKEMLTRLLQAAISAPSNTNRQPWRFAVVTDPIIKQSIVDAVKERTNEMRKIIESGHHAEEFKGYGDFFHEPLQSANALVIPQYRTYPDLIANLIESGNGDPEQYDTASAMQAELCSTCAGIMTLLTQAHSEGLGACWMAGPMVARQKIQEILNIRHPWRMVGGIALGFPKETPSPKPRKPLKRVVQWF